MERANGVLKGPLCQRRLRFPSVKKGAANRSNYNVSFVFLVHAKMKINKNLHHNLEDAFQEDKVENGVSMSVGRWVNLQCFVCGANTAR